MILIIQIVIIVTLLQGYTDSYSNSQSDYSSSEDEEPVKNKRNQKMKGGAIISKADLRSRL